MTTKNLYYLKAPDKTEFGDRVTYIIGKYWVLVFGIAFGLYAGLPFLAPFFMKIGWVFPGKTIYFIYSFLCHQLPERSYFLFGPKISYSLAEVQAVWQNTNNLLILRQFIGNPQMGWKMAWSDRMVSMFVSILFFAPIWWFLRRYIRKLPWWVFVIFILPLAVDGSSHFLSDFAGIGQGFRDNNAWLAALTHSTYPISFYAGDAWNSFNGLARLLTGILFGAGIVWVIFPYVDEFFIDMVKGVEYKWYCAGIKSNNPAIVRTEKTHDEKYVTH